MRGVAEAVGRFWAEMLYWGGGSGPLSMTWVFVIIVFAVGSIVGLVILSLIGVVSDLI